MHTEKLVIDEVQLIHKIIDGVHYFIGNDKWSRGVIAMDEDCFIAMEEAMDQLRVLLRLNHNVACGEWEVIDL
jgi:hypothetical protein